MQGFDPLHLPLSEYLPILPFETDTATPRSQIPMYYIHDLKQPLHLGGSGSAFSVPGAHHWEHGRDGLAGDNLPEDPGDSLRCREAYEPHGYSRCCYSNTCASQADQVSHHLDHWSPPPGCERGKRHLDLLQRERQPSDGSNRNRVYWQRWITSSHRSSGHHSRSKPALSGTGKHNCLDAAGRKRGKHSRL